ncbi:MAG TPA: hypothetical protein VJ783_12340 [Pirellulales bacterium]|nr:hypothetical protein [Pirellulales bacterium]
MIRFNDDAPAWDGSDGRGPARGDWQWAELVSEVCECFERGAFADVTAAQAALDSTVDVSLDEPLGKDEIALCLRSHWPAAEPAPVMFAYRSGRPLRTELLERRDALSVTPGLHATGCTAVAARIDLLPFISVVAERSAYISSELAGRPTACHRAGLGGAARSKAAARVSRARAALHDFALAEFVSAGELALTG